MQRQTSHSLLGIGSELGRPQPWNSEPVKAIQVQGNLLLAGEGGQVLIWSLKNTTKDPPQIVKVFPEEWPITSISTTCCRKAEVHVLVTSLYFYRKIILDTTMEMRIEMCPVMEGRYGEILGGHCFQSGEYIVYDQNNYATLHEVDAESNDERVSIFEGHLGAPDCVSITGNSKNEVLIFVATSSRVSICKLELTGDRKEVKPLCTFCLPKGVIFSVNYYPEAKLIITTCDDRSVSLWKCEFLGPNSFLSPGDEPLGANGISIALQATLEGHTSRVFNAILAHGHVVSVGEDSNVVAWSLQDVTRNHVIGGHGGSTLWSCTYHPRTGDIFTCGDNGSIFKWRLTKDFQGYNSTGFCELYPGWGSEIRLPKSRQDYPRVVKCFDQSASLVTTNFGKVLIVDKDAVLYCNEDPSWAKYIAFAWSPEKDMYVTGSLTGVITFNTLHPVQAAEHRMQLKLGDNLHCNLPIPEKIMSIHFLGSSVLIISTITSLVKYGLAPRSDRTALLPAPTLEWTVKQKSNVNCTLAWKNVIFVGLDNGKIKAYNNISGQKMYEFKARHNKFGVGGIIEYQGQLVTGGRDSSLNFFFVEDQIGEDEDCTGTNPVTHLKTVPLPFLWVGTLEKYKNDLLVCGFESGDFVIYSLKRAQIIGRTNCGGAHRMWDFMLSEDGTGIFSHIRVRKVYKTFFQLDQYITNSVKEGFHTEDLNSVIEIPNSTDNAVLLVTGSQDGAVKISTFSIQRSGHNRDKTRFVKDSMETICDHTSGVICLHYQESKSNSEGYVFSGGGKAELVLTKIYLQGSSLKKYENVRRFRFESSIDFRIMDIKSLLLPAPDGNLEVGKGGTLLGFAACSDGILRIVRENRNFKFSRPYLKASGTGNCLTTLHLVQDGCSSTDKVIVISGTSAGDIILWSITLTLQNKSAEDSWLENSQTVPNRILKLGIMAISSLDLLQIQETTMMYVGGDDGSIHRITIPNSLFGEEFDMMRRQMTNDGILGLQHHDHDPFGDELSLASANIYFVSGGKLFKSDLNVENISCVRIPIQDGKGFTICKRIKHCDTSHVPFVSYGKGISLSTL